MMEIQTKKSELVKMATEWTFSQSTGIVMAVGFILYTIFNNYQSAKRIDALELKQDTFYQQQVDLFRTVVEPNTKALNENTRVMQEFNNYLRLKSFSK